MRVLWLAVGAVSLALALIGVVLPLLPTTPFLLVAAYAFARSSPRLHAWLIAHPRFGSMISNWREQGAISRPVKIFAIIVMAATFALSWALGLSPTVLIIHAIVLSGAAAFILSRPEPRKDDD